MIVDVAVIPPVIVAVHVNLNGPVAVIGTLDEIALDRSRHDQVNFE